MTKFLFFVCFFNILQQLCKWCTANNLQDLIHCDHIVFIRHSVIDLIGWSTIVVNWSWRTLINHLGFLWVYNICRFISESEQFWLMQIIAEIRCNHSLCFMSILLLLIHWPDFIITFFKGHYANLFFLERFT